MKIKNKIISLAVCLSFCLVALFNAVYFKCMNFDVYDFPFDERVMLQRIVDDIGDKNRRYS